ncbi:pyridoxal phosphate-dependent transferase [Zopfochytrium polystomum]|nr:pyridoxal phosphate-dependent transferase [Zopfochytrium polystomum]
MVGSTPSPPSSLSSSPSPVYLDAAGSARAHWISFAASIAALDRVGVGGDGERGSQPEPCSQAAAALTAPVSYRPAVTLFAPSLSTLHPRAQRSRIGSDRCARQRATTPCSSHCRTSGLNRSDETRFREHFDSIHHHALRSCILSLLGVSLETHSLIFTTSATGAFKLVAEARSWRNARLWRLSDSHTSVVGMREYVHRDCLATQQQQQRDDNSEQQPSHSYEDNRQDVSLAPDEVEAYLERHLAQGQNGESSFSENAAGDPGSRRYVDHDLFVFPAQSNFNGRQFPLRWIRQFQSLRFARENDSRVGNTGRNWLVMVDAAAHGPINLRDHPADMVVLSMYKLFGFPTGLAALIVENNVVPFLIRSQRVLQTVDLSNSGVSVRESIQHTLTRLFEGDSLPPLAALHLQCGLDWLDSQGGWYSIKAKAVALAEITRAEMRSLRYQDPGYPPLCHVFGDLEENPCTPIDRPSVKRQAINYGPIVAFVLLESSGAVIPASKIIRLAGVYGFSIRHGCFCNVGACDRYLATLPIDGSPQPTSRRESLVQRPRIPRSGQRLHACGDDEDAEGRPASALRVSFGAGNSEADVHQWIAFLRFHFLTPSAANVAAAVSSKRPSTTIPPVDFFVEHSPTSVTTSPSPIPSLSSLSLASLPPSPRTPPWPSPTSAFMETQNASLAPDSLSPSLPVAGILTKIRLYPIKSCAGLSVARWPLSPSGGLLYDREFLLVDAQGRGISLKKERRLSEVRPVKLDLEAGVLEVKATGMEESLFIRLLRVGSRMAKVEGSVGCDVAQVCSRRVLVSRHEDPAVSSWFTKFLGYPAFLVVSASATSKTEADLSGGGDTGPRPTPSDFQNDSQFLAVSESSYESIVPLLLEPATSSGGDAEGNAVPAIDQFRSNFDFAGMTPFEEDLWQEGQRLWIGDVQFSVNGRCNRCGAIGSRLYSAVWKHRKGSGVGNKRVHFGVYLSSFVSQPETTATARETTATHVGTTMLTPSKTTAASSLKAFNAEKRGWEGVGSDCCKGLKFLAVGCGVKVDCEDQDVVKMK